MTEATTDRLCHIGSYLAALVTLVLLGISGAALVLWLGVPSLPRWTLFISIPIWGLGVIGWAQFFYGKCREYRS